MVFVAVAWPCVLFSGVFFFSPSWLEFSWKRERGGASPHPCLDCVTPCSYKTGIAYEKKAKKGKKGKNNGASFKRVEHALLW
ncbi:hypothetical protein V8C35DRAFT_314056 [Trichoderma chlorosporum]